MKRICLFLIAAIFIACNKTELPKPMPYAKADFTYTADRVYCSFSNTSSDGLRAYHWDFGDGGSSGGNENPMHIYSGSGTYSVTLTCHDQNNFSYRITKPVTITDNTPKPGGDPTIEKKLYFKGFKFYSIPYSADGYFYRCTLSGHNLWGHEDPYITTDYSVIYSSELPHTIGVTPQLIADTPNPFDCFKDMKLTVIYKHKENDDTYNVYAHDLDLQTMTESENIVTYTNGLKVGLLFYRQ